MSILIMKKFFSRVPFRFHAILYAKKCVMDLNTRIASF